MANKNFAADWAAREPELITLPGGNTCQLVPDVDPLLLARYVDSANDESMGTDESIKLFDDVLHGFVIPDDHAKLDAALALRGRDYIGLARRSELIEYCIQAIAGRPFENASTSSPGPAAPASTTPSTDTSALRQGAVMPTPLRASAP